VDLTREDRLLHRYTAQDSQAAFGELVRQHHAFVYSVCLRKLEDRQMAEDVTQAVFLLLAAKAGSFRRGTVLTGWLFQTALLACRNAARAEARRRHYERKAVEQMETAGCDEDALWNDMRPLLDDALEELGVKDRDAVLLRYVDGLSLQEVGVALGITTAAAHKRIMRALERMKRSLGRGGAALPAIDLGALLSDRIVEAAPASHADILSAMTGHAASGAAQTICDSVLRELRHTKIKTAAACAFAGAVIAGTTIAFAAVNARRTASAIHPAVPPASAPPAIILLGRVVDTRNNPVAGASVTIVRYDDRGGAQPVALKSVVTDRFGLYHVPAPDTGHDVWQTIADSGERIGFGIPAHDTRLLAPTRIALRLVDPSGKPMPNVTIKPAGFAGIGSYGNMLQSLQAGCPKRLEVTSDSDGQAVLTGLPGGCSTAFEVLGQQYTPILGGENTVHLSSGAKTPPRTIHLVRPATVKGTLVYAYSGTPAVGVRIGAQSIGVTRWTEAVTDDHGRYRLIGLLPGQYNIGIDESCEALRNEWVAAALPDLTIDAGQNMTAQPMKLVRGGWVEGTATFRKSHKPIVGEQVGVYGPAHPQTSPWVEAQVIGADGHFRLRVPPGDQYVYVMTANDAQNGVDIKVTEGATAHVDLEAD